MYCLKNWQLIFAMQNTCGFVGKDGAVLKPAGVGSNGEETAEGKWVFLG
jgi:hypothetical protein